MYEEHQVRSFFAELLNVFAAILLWPCHAVKVVVLAFAWVVIIGCAITKNR